MIDFVSYVFHSNVILKSRLYTLLYSCIVTQAYETNQLTDRPIVILTVLHASQLLLKIAPRGSFLTLTFFLWRAAFLLSLLLFVLLLSTRIKCRFRWYLVRVYRYHINLHFALRADYKHNTIFAIVCPIYLVALAFNIIILGWLTTKVRPAVHSTIDSAIAVGHMVLLTQRLVYTTGY